MARLRVWLRSPRNLWILFLLVILLPAATLILLGVRLLEQDRALASQRQTENLERAADRGVRALEQDLQSLLVRLAGAPWTAADVPGDSVYVLLRPGRIEALPSGRLPYFPLAEGLKEPPGELFRELESLEFAAKDIEKALEISRKLAASPDASIRAGALLRQARILRKMGDSAGALAAYDALGRVDSASISGEPAGLVARRARCTLFEEQSRNKELREEAERIAAEMRAGRWKLDQVTFLHAAGQISRWLGSEFRPSEQGELLAAGADWLFKNQTNAPGFKFQPVEGGQVTIVWSSGAAFIAAPQYVEKHWLRKLRQVVSPARAYLPDIADSPPAGGLRVRRTAAETGLPWTVVLSAADEEPAEFRARRRNLLAGLAALLVLAAAGSYFIWRSVTRDLAVARLQSDFVAAVSHEFRTPLTALRQFNELLAEEDNLTPQKRCSYHQAQTRATERLHRLVESLLDFGRMEAGRRPFRFGRLDAGALTRDLTEEFRSEIQDPGYVIECHLNSSQYPVDADSEALSRALWNLLDNAVRYSGENRRIEVQVGRKAEAVSISVRDHGIGIPATEQKRIFQKFVRGAAAKSLGIKGTGIGLAMVKHIVDAHGGRVEVTSAPGEGSTFTIVLPAKGS